MKQCVEHFISAINGHNIEALCSSMTDDHQFIDSQGNILAGKENVRAGWIGYFQLFPDYQIEVNEILIQGNMVAAFGFAGGTLHGDREQPENYWRLPASWKAIVRDGKIFHWQVYADTKIPYDILMNVMK